MQMLAREEKETAERLVAHCLAYPHIQPEDAFKFLFQSAFGCEHMVTDEATVLTRIRLEYEALSATDGYRVEPLDGQYSRVPLSYLSHGLKAETLARIFCLSAQDEPMGKAALLQKLCVAQELMAQGRLPFDRAVFEKRLKEWEKEDYAALHHSDGFRLAYRPAYRVIANRYADCLPLFAQIDALSNRESVVVAIEGGSAAGKTTLARTLSQVYDCNVFHMDDFFLRPVQRTSQRLAEVGGNLDRERFAEEVLLPLQNREAVCYRRFDCQTQTLTAPVTLPHKKLTVVEGVYSTHPFFEKYYDLSVFLDVDPQLQRERIAKRNAPCIAQRYFEEWIPMEERYFSCMQVKSRCSLFMILAP